MSNRVRDLYAIVIDNVIRETQNEFEESGDDPYVLNMLRDTWKRRLMSMNVSKQPLWEEMNTGEDATDNSPVLGAGSLGKFYTNDLKSEDGGATGTDAMLYEAGGSSVSKAFLDTGNDVSQVDRLAPLARGSNNESFDMLAGTALSSQNDGNRATSDTGVFNPLDTSRSMTSQPMSSTNFSEDLNNQIHNAMNSDKVPQNDGPQDDELNSDLDDSEDELNSNDDDEEAEQTQMMLCLYEKVHKVKTRWKYTLKDGVANINGLDYVFSKATGESEW